MESGLFDLHSAGLDGVNLIEASAGTGKTYAIEGLFLRLLLEKEIRVENILVVTFTEAATAELRERISSRIRAALDVFQQREEGDDFLRRLAAQSRDPERDQERLKLALAGFDEAAIYTIHGFSLRMLNDFAFESQSLFEMEFQADEAGLLSELAADYWRNQVYDADKDFVEIFTGDYPKPQSLAATALTMHVRPVKQLLPRMTATSPREIYRDIAMRYDALRQRWKGEQQAVRSLICDNRHWHKKYQENRDLYLEQIALFFEGGRPFVNWKCLLNLTPEVISRKTKKGGPATEHPLFRDFSLFAETVSRFAVGVKLDFVRYADRELSIRKRQRNLRSFDDLLQDLHRVLASPRGLELAGKMRRKFAVALIDEFQDTDPLQYEIFRTAFMGGSPRLFFIGDPKQSIYSFRGADIYAYLQAENDADRKYTLPVNYRSDQDLVRAINTVFSCHQDPFAEGRIRFSPAAGNSRNPRRSLLIDGKPQVPMQIWYRFSAGDHDALGPARRQIAEAMASYIAALLNLGAAGRAALSGASGPVALQPGDVAVLVRTHKEANMMKEALARRKVPAVLHVNSSIFESGEFHDVRAIAEAVADFRQEYKVRSALLSEVLGGSGTELYQWIHDEGRWEEILSNFRRYHEIWAESGFQQMMTVLLQQQQVREQLLRLPDGERRLTNVLHVMELFHQAEAESSLTMGGLLRWVNRIRHDGLQRDQYQIRLETDAAAVRISTVHTSKGLEFPLVFIPFSWGRRDVRDCFFHDPDNNYAMTWDLEGKEQSREYAQQEDLAENLRLFYVALTRAKHSCHVVWGDIPRTKNSCYTYLFHPDPEADRWSDLRRLQEASGGTIMLMDLPGVRSEVYVPPRRAAVDLACRERQRSLAPDWGISSFSGIAARKKDPYEGLDHDHHQQPAADEAEAEWEATEQSPMLSFPGGSRTGDCFHEIFEDLIFSERDKEKITGLVRKKLSKFDFDQALVPAGVKLVRDVLAREICPAPEGGVWFSLARIEAAQTVKEMGFHFPLTTIRSRILVEQVAICCRTPSHYGLLQALRQLDFVALQGFMKGFIDLVFCHEERFYILDWKTNVLGSQLTDYTHDKLQQAIEGHLFNLQYYIYTVALHKYLQIRLPGTYDFDRHFGGVFYFFLRGISAGKSDTGVFYDSLTGSKELIVMLEKVFSGAAP